MLAINGVGSGFLISLNRLAAEGGVPFIPYIFWASLIAGTILETVPAYAQANPEFRIALLHIDVDVYEPSLVTLRHFYDRVVPGGLIVLDDYGTVSGETTAVEEFFADKSPHLEKLSISHVPAFIRK